MHLPLRQQLTTGVALVGAAVIVASPIAPPPPDIQIAAPAVTTANVELAATWAQLLADSATNLGILFDQASFEYVIDPPPSDPEEPTTAITFSPVLQQIFFNTNNSIQSIIQAAIGQGDTEMAIPDVIDAVLAAIAQPIDNFLAVAGLVLSPEALRGFAIGLAGPLLSTVFATGEAIENVLDPNTPEDFVPALINFIPTIADGLLNGGYGEVPDFLLGTPPPFPVRPGGLLNGPEGVPGPNGVILPGLASTFLLARDEIAEELGIERPPPGLVLTTVTGGDEKLAGTEITNGTLDDPVSPVTERKGPVKRILESFKAVPGGNADVGVRASSERPRPVLGAVKTVTKSIKAVGNGVRDALGLPPRPDSVKAEPVKADSPE